MSEGAGGATTPEARAPGSSSAGAMLRAAREAQGLHVAVLAASIKVPQRKLEALEGDRLGELPDVTFARALAKTVCRALKIDPQPILDRMPDLSGHGLDKVHQGINATFRDRPDRAAPIELSSALKRPAVWLPLLIVLAAGFVFLMPQQWFVPSQRAAAPAAPAAGASAPVELASAVALTPPAPVAGPASEAAALPEPAPSPAASAAVASAESVIELKVSGESWIEVLDASGATLLQRKLEPGEYVGLDGTPPFRVKIGNAAVTRLDYRGQAIDLTPSTRDNVARLELK